MEREVPSLPEAGESIRVIVDTDAACEIDDLYAIALLLLSQERFRIEGFVAAHYGDSGGPQGIDKSYQIVQTVLEKAGMAGQFPVYKGADPFQYSEVPPRSEGVDFIIERAMDERESDPLWVVSLGACTDIASACLIEPKIKERVVSFWHGRTQWPAKCWNFNAYNDLKAVRVLFSCGVPLVLFDTGTYLRSSMEETETRLKPYGELGAYLHEFRNRSKSYQSPTKGFFDLGDIATLVDPSLSEYEIVNVPGVNWDMNYDHSKTYGKMLRIYQIDNDECFDLFFRKFKEAYASP